MCSCLVGPGAFLRDTVPVQSALLGLVELLQAAVCLLQLAEQTPSSCQQGGHGCGILGQLREDVCPCLVLGAAPATFNDAQDDQRCTCAG